MIFCLLLSFLALYGARQVFYIHSVEQLYDSEGGVRGYFAALGHLWVFFGSSRPPVSFFRLLTSSLRPSVLLSDISFALSFPSRKQQQYFFVVSFPLLSIFTHPADGVHDPIFPHFSLSESVTAALVPHHILHLLVPPTQVLLRRMFAGVAPS